METTFLYILSFLLITVLLVAFLPQARAERVMLFVPLILKLLSISAVVRALKGNKGDVEIQK